MESWVSEMLRSWQWKRVGVAMRIATHNHQARLGGLLVAAHIENVVQARDVALKGAVDLGVCHFGGGRAVVTGNDEWQ